MIEKCYLLGLFARLVLEGFLFECLACLVLEGFDRLGWLVLAGLRLSFVLVLAYWWLVLVEGSFRGLVVELVVRIECLAR